MSLALPQAQRGIPVKIEEPDSPQARVGAQEIGLAEVQLPTGTFQLTARQGTG